jgi:hypothetical protein
MCQITNRTKRRQPSLKSRTATTMVVVMLLAMMTTVSTSRGQTLPVPDNQVRTTDLIRLATDSSDALGELKIAKLKLLTLQSLSASTPITSLEIRIAEINVATAEQKIGLLRKITEKELNAAKANLETLKKIWGMIGVEDAATAPPRPDIVRAEADIEILQMILDAQ